MKVIKTSPVSLRMNVLEIDVTQEELDRVANRFNTGELVQDIIPHISAPEREFIMSGITPEEWIMVFGSDDE